MSGAPQRRQAFGFLSLVPRWSSAQIVKQADGRRGARRKSAEHAVPPPNFEDVYEMAAKTFELELAEL